MYERACGFCGSPWAGGWGLLRPSLGIDLKFCGRACLKSWEAKVSFSKNEVEAIEKMLPAMGAYVAASGIMEKPFKDCSKDEILGLFATTVKTFRATFQEVLGSEVPF